MLNRILIFNAARQQPALVSALLLSLFTFGPVQAAELDFSSLFGPDLSPYSLEYEARYDGYKAEAKRTLEAAEDGQILMNSFIEMKILFQTLSSIDETSQFSVSDGVITPHSYTFEQSGLGSRDRTQVFNHEENSVQVTIDENNFELGYSDSILDPVTAMLYLREKVSVGETDIIFQVVDKSEIEEQHYQVTGNESLETPLGTFSAVRVERVRDAGSSRKTTLWFLPDYGYVMARFEQINNDEDEKLELNLSAGTYNGTEIIPLQAD